MNNIKPATRIIAILVIVFGVAGLLFLWNKLHEPTQIVENPPEVIQPPADGSLAIKVDDFGIAPFDIMYIRGGGLDPDAATSIIYTTRTGEKLIVPALEVTSGTIAVSVPPIAYDKIKGAFSPDQVSLRIIQAKKLGDQLVVRTSNTSSYFMIYNPEILSAFAKADADQIPKGAVTQMVTIVAVERLKLTASKVVDNPQLSESITKAQKGMEKILAAIETIVKNPKAKVEFKMNDGSTAFLTMDDIAWLDAFNKGFLGMIEKQASLVFKEEQSKFIDVANAQAVNGCVATLMKNDYRIKQLDSIATQFCNVLEPEASLTEKPKDDRYFKWEYYYQAPLALALATKEVGEWGLGKQIWISTALSIGIDYAYDKKLPDWISLGSLSLGAGATYLSTIGKPFLGELLLATGMWDILCATLPGTGWMDSRSIMLGTGQILADVWKNPENFLYIANAMTGGKLSIKVDELYIPENAVMVKFDGTGIKNGGYNADIKLESTLVVTPSPAPISPEPIKYIPVPDSSPKNPSPTLQPTKDCWQLKQEAYDQCKAGCGNQQDCYSAYSECTPGCDSVHDLIDKSNCINTCLGTFSKCTGASAKCTTDCMNADYAYKCY